MFSNGVLIEGNFELPESLKGYTVPKDFLFLTLAVSKNN